MNKKIIIVSLVVVVLLLILIPFFINNKDKFYLDNKYYNKGEYIDASSDEINNLIIAKSSFILFTYNSYCTLSVPCDIIFKQTMTKNKISILQIPFEDFKNTKLYNEVKFAPSIIIIKNGKIIDYLKSDKDEDLDKYQDSNIFENWLKKYIIFK